MSRISSKVSPAPSFCNVCKDAGLSQQQFMSHSIKNERGVVCCPTLLSNVCRRCSKFGHTQNYCAVVLKTDRTPAKVAAKPTPVYAKAVTNTFAALLDSDSEDDVPANVTVRKTKHTNNDVPDNVTLRNTNTIKKNWADYDTDDEDDFLA